MDGCEVRRLRQSAANWENSGVWCDGSHGQRLTTPRGPVPRRREEEEGGRTWEKTCRADSLILPIAPTRGELVVVFTSVMAATCVGGMGAGWSATKTAKLAEKKCAVSAIRRLDGKRGGGAGSIEHARRAPPTPPHTTERAAAAPIVPRPDASPIALRAGFRSGERPDSMSHEPTALLARVRDRHGATLAARGGSELARAVSGREYRDRSRTFGLPRGRTDAGAVAMISRPSRPNGVGPRRGIFR